ncbi:copper chaperone CopZ [Pseudogracilibacillus auburnensis]|uniref:Copper chaperone CopZ n=1 Tax=Pseudogracilibacillus auburnensis TaxID=1494959 RepID=A0A2V3VTY2_9BACI|nr:copper chaperone CopZ [Pseudogracilibacillus auburnensis]MBO1003342.1 copper chaperone CopZ [Pseudogracilibacillus auburnensis]PXW85357.1 copper chaperone [Pseudogracilibacillus auburnensis]
MVQTTLHVQGMSCGHCVKAVEGSVSALNGVKSVHVHLDEQTVDINFDSNLVSIEEIKNEIEEQGYEIEK